MKNNTSKKHIPLPPVGVVPCREHKMQAIERLSSNMAHKVNNSLTYAINYLFVLRESAHKDIDREMLRKVESGINNAKDFIQEIIDLTRYSFHPEITVNLNTELPKILSRLPGPEIRFKNGLKTSAEVRATVPGLSAVLNVLIENAVESGAAEISISARESKKNALLTVSDNGSGIDDGIMVSLFEPLNTSKQTKRGLGLYTLYYIIKSFGGKINCRSTRGKGTKFYITLNKI